MKKLICCKEGKKVVDCTEEEIANYKLARAEKEARHRERLRCEICREELKTKLNGLGFTDEEISLLCNK